MRRFLTSIAAASLAIIAGLTVFVGTAGAEIVGEQETWWGVDGEGPSRTIGNWDALTWAVEPVGGTVFVGGKFTEATNGPSSYNQSYIAAFDAGDGKFVPWFRPDLGGPVLAFEQSPDGGLFVGGEMDEWNGVTTGALQKIDPVTGDRWPGWNTRVYGGTSVVRDMRIEADGWLYVMGSFTTATEGNGPIPVSGAIRMNPLTGDIDQNWLPTATGGAVWGSALSQTTNEVYLAGWFTSVNGDSSARGFAGVSSVNGSVLHDRDTIEYNTCAGCSQYYRLYDVVTTEHGNVFVGGEQHALFMLKESQNLAMSRMHYTGCNRAVTQDCTRRGGEFQEIERIGNRVYATCHCWGDHMSDTDLIMHGSYPTGTYTGRISALAAYDPATGVRIQSFNPYMSGNTGGFSVKAASDGCLWLAGGLSQVGTPGNQRQARDLARLCDSAGPGPDPQPDPTPPPVPTCSASNNGTTATVNWPLDDGDSVIIERRVDGGNWAWRGKVDNPGTSFSETIPNGSITEFRALTKWASKKSLPTGCSPAINLTVANQPAARPASCSASNAGFNATISWTASANANDYRVYRSIDGGNQFWRGLSTTTSFSDTLRAAGGSHTYSVQARGADNVWSASRVCSPALDPNGGGGPAATPASCSASNAGFNATISWTASANANDYRVYRSIDGGNQFWRGLSTTTSFSDTLRAAGGSHTYSVQARGADNVWSASRVCSPALDPNGGGGPAATPASCSASNAGFNATISWTASANANDYRVYRSIDGGNQFWRGLSTTTSFSDTLRAAGGSHTYSVQARGADNVWSASRVCSPALDPNGGGGPAATPASCSATKAGQNATISWASSPGATDYRVYRSVNGGNTFWRGLSSTTSFTDSLWANASHVYSVQARGADGIWSASRICNPTLVTP